MPLSSSDIRNDLSVGSINPTAGTDQYRTRIVPQSRGPAEVVTKLHDFQHAMSSQNVLIFPHDRPKFFMVLQLSEYQSRNVLAGTVQFNDQGTIVLPLPRQIQDGHNVTYDEHELGLLGGAIVGAAASTLQSVAKNVGTSTQPVNMLGMLQDAGTQAMDTLGNIGVGGGAALGGAALLPKKYQQDVTDITTAAFGFSPNQMLTIALKGPAFKRYQLNWNLVPKTFEESDTIRKIIRTLNNAQHPDLTANGFVYKFPTIIRPAFRCSGDQNQFHRYLFRFKPSVIETMQINYAPGGVNAFYHDSGPQDANPPESVEIIMQCLELETWLHGDFLDGGDAYDTQGNLNRWGGNHTSGT